MGEQSWKTDERRIAEILGGVRVPINGRGLAADVDHPKLAVEVKRTMRRMALVDRALEQAAQAVKASGRDILPAAVIHYTGTQMANARVVMRLEDFARLFAVTLPVPETNEQASFRVLVEDR